MDPLTILTIIQTAVQCAGTVKGMIDQGGVTPKSLEAAVPQLLPELVKIGAALFPKVAPQMQAVAVVSAAFDPNVTKWLQGALNKLLTPNPNLTVDGIYGPKTQAAVEALQQKLGLKVDGWAGEITQGAIQMALAKL